ncbi:MAG: Gfo/Idh/MocA family oxidoreductase [Bacteroidaceae bacterium]|nr:Gfo/Idh/MocA family oxidoreductase [Bacteroidaceae bacterium]
MENIQPTKVKIGLIGLGQRGTATLRRYACIPDAEIIALADLSADALRQGQALLEQGGQHNIALFQGESQWRLLCQNTQIDIVYICTDWGSHARMAVYAMQQGKHVALEVPAAMTVQECWQLVLTSRETGRYCTMLENCCYDTFHLGIMEMNRKGLFGEISHCEGAYIHDLRTDQGWMSYTVRDHLGNPYPTHGLGPVCQLMDIGSSDHLRSLVSMSAPGHINNTLIKTERGRTILLQFDERTPRPYNRLQTLCGTLGFAQKYPLPTLQFDGQPPITGAEAEAKIESHWSSEMRQLITEGRHLGVENLMNYVMDRRLVHALRHGIAPDITVCDAALWSCVTELSALSASAGSKPIEIPDFTKNP